MCHSERSEESRPDLSRTVRENQSEILRFAQDDSEGLGMTPFVDQHTYFTLMSASAGIPGFSS